MEPSHNTPFILQVEVGLVQNFCTLLCDPVRRWCVVVDPAFEVDRLGRLLDEHGLRLAAVLLTHSHFDHIEGVPALLAHCDRRGPVYIGDGEQAAVLSACAEANVACDLVPLGGGERLELGGFAIEVLPTPGHTLAGRSYYLPEQGAVLTGDTLFVGSCGRPASRATAPTLFASLRLLSELPEETRIYCGHNYGPTATSTIGWERQHNPYLASPTAEHFTALTRARL
jgi:glyoxylase-like metal-dependent hydrolase (beta-lactamase superfamily II)